MINQVVDRKIMLLLALVMLSVLLACGGAGQNNNAAQIPQADTAAGAPSVAGSPVLLAHMMAAAVDEKANTVAEQKYEFTESDTKCYSWLSLGDIRTGTVEWRWYSPHGNLVNTWSYTIPPPARGVWNEYYCWHWLRVNIPGKWQVKVYLDGREILQEEFTYRAGGENK